MAKKRQVPDAEEQALQETLELLRKVGRDLKATNETADVAVKKIKKIVRRTKQMTRLLGRVP